MKRFAAIVVLLAFAAQAGDPPRYRGGFERYRNLKKRAASAVCLTNLCTQPNAFNAWTALGAGGPAAPTVTANQAQAPDGSGLTADRVQFNACASTGQASVVFLNHTVTAATQYTSSVWVYGNGASGALSVYNYDSTAGTGRAQACSFSNGSWTRCTLTRTNTNTTLRLGVGCMNDSGVITGASSTGAADVFLWGAGLQVGPTAACFASAESYLEHLLRVLT